MVTTNHHKNPTGVKYVIALEKYKRALRAASITQAVLLSSVLLQGHRGVLAGVVLAASVLGIDHEVSFGVSYPVRGAFALLSEAGLFGDFGSSALPASPASAPSLIASSRAWCKLCWLVLFGGTGSGVRLRGEARSVERAGTGPAPCLASGGPGIACAK